MAMNTLLENIANTKTVEEGLSLLYRFGFLEGLPTEEKKSTGEVMWEMARYITENRPKEYSFGLDMYLCIFPIIRRSLNGLKDVKLQEPEKFYNFVDDFCKVNGEDICSTCEKYGGDAEAMLTLYCGDLINRILKKEKSAESE